MQTTLDRIRRPTVAGQHDLVPHGTEGVLACLPANATKMNLLTWKFPTKSGIFAGNLDTKLVENTQSLTKPKLRT